MVLKRTNGYSGVVLLVGTCTGTGTLSLALSLGSSFEVWSTSFWQIRQGTSNP